MVFGTHVSEWVVLAGLALLLWVARGVLPPFIVAGILAYVLSPLVDELAARSGIRRAWIALAVFGGVLLVTLAVVWLAGARAGAELHAIEREGPSIIETVVNDLTGGQSIDILGQSLTAVELARRIDVALRDELGTPSQAIQAIRAGFELLLDVILVFLALAYLLVDGQSLFQYLMRFVPPDHRARIQHLSVQIHGVLARYLRGQLLLIVLMSSVTFVLLETVFRLPYALWIGILTGILEIIPLIGPLIAGAIACTVGFTQGGAPEAAALAIMYFILRQTEDQLVMPIVVGRAVHVHPLVTIFAVLTGEKMAGVLGAVLAVPTAAAIKVILDYAYPTRSDVPRIELPHETAPAAAAADATLVVERR